MRQSDNPDLGSLSDLEIATQACRKGADVAAGYFRHTAAINKAQDGTYDPVTEGDKAAERAIRQVLEAGRPRDSILGEEFGHKDQNSPRCWTIDPIDGTRAFVAGAPTWGTLVGLKTGDDFTIGAACQPVAGDMFSGDNTQAWLNGSKITTRESVDIAALRLATTDDDLIDAPFRSAFQALKSKAAITRYGLDWYAYCLLAAGHLDVVFECGLQVYDIAALVPIVRGAGGVVTDVKGGHNIGPTVVAASCPQTHALVIAALET
ncbi:MAG: inositol monophosphatase family protein [Pseudomonadota bacterium]